MKKEHEQRSLVWQCIHTLQPIQGSDFMIRHEKGNAMKCSISTRLLILVIVFLFISACSLGAVATPTPLPETEKSPEEVDPTFTPPPPTEAPASQEELKEKWQDPIIAYALLGGICESVQETIEKQQSDEKDESQLSTQIIGVQLLISMVNNAIVGQDPQTNITSHQENITDHLKNISNWVNQWANNDISTDDIAANVNTECQTVSKETEDIVASAKNEGLNEETFQGIMNELQEKLTEISVGLNEANPSINSEPAVPEGPGMSRQNPIPIGQVVSVPNWELQVLEMKRGEEAWQMILAANQFNEPAAEGMEYVLARVKARNISTVEEERSISQADFSLTGSKYIKYDTAYIVSPEPALDASLFPNGEAEGWVPLLAAQDETGLILIYDELMNFDSDSQRFIALEEGAVQSIPAELAAIQPNETGLDRSNPAALGEMVVTEDWEITILEVQRGAPAWNSILAANQFNEPAADGMEYILARVKVRNISGSETAESVSSYLFKSTGSANVMHDNVYVVSPTPALNASLFPGGEATGWVALQAKIGETGLMAVFEPVFAFADSERRFFNLE